LQALTVAASILLAAVVGGVVFVLIDGWQRRDDEPPEARTERLPDPVPAPRAAAPRRDVPAAPSPLWSGWADRDSR
jgi:hypothetical protein